MQENTLTTLDLRIINALQIRPRAPWAQLAPILGANAATLNRRWRELCDAGLAWITSMDQSNWSAAALVEISCHSGANQQVATAMAETKEVIAVDLTAGGRDIVATIATRSEAELWTFLLEELPKVGDVRSVSSHPIARTFTTGSAWRARALDPSETRRITNLPTQAPSRSDVGHPELERNMMELLNVDGRASATSLGAALGESPRRVREALATMQFSGRLVQRTDVARGVSGWPVSAWYFLRVPASKMDEAAKRLDRLEEVRLITHTVGPYDLIMDVWLRTLSEVQRLENQLELRIDGVSTADRSVVLRSVKHMGQILDAEGRATGRSRL